MSLTSGLSANRKLSRNGLLGDLPEADFWPGTTSGVPVTRGGMPTVAVAVSSLPHMQQEDTVDAEYCC
jgi:hypothetical protein